MHERCSVSTLRRWLVAFACAWINVFLFCVFRSSGVLYVALVDTFGCSYQEASWPLTLASGVAALTCLPSGFLSHYFEKRTIVASGVLICSAGIASCYFANGFTAMLVGLGIAHGVGIGTVTVSLPAIISEYFGQQRAAAIGLSFAGITAGAFVFPLLCKYLLDTYSLKTTLLIMGAIVSNGLFGVLLLRPKGSDYDAVANVATMTSDDQEAAAIAADKEDPVMDGQMRRKHFISRRGSSSVHCDVNHASEAREKKSEIANGKKTTPSSSTSPELLAEVTQPNSPSSETIVTPDKDGYLAKDETRRKDEPATAEAASAGDVLLNEKRDVFANRISKEISLRRSLKEHLLRDAALVRSPYFWLISFTYLCYVTMHMTLLMILPDFATDAGVDKSRSVLLLSMFAVTDLFGRLLPGWLSYAKIMSNKTLYIVSISGLGAIFLLYPLLLSERPTNIEQNFAILLGLTLSFGFLAGPQMTLPSVIMAEYLGLANMSVGFGLSNFIYGMVSFGRPFLIGYVKDRTNRYDELFYLLGVLALSSALSWLLEILIVKIRSGKKSVLNTEENFSRNTQKRFFESRRIFSN